MIAFALRNVTDCLSCCPVLLMITSSVIVYHQCDQSCVSSFFEAKEQGHFRGWQEDCEGRLYPFCVCLHYQRSYLLGNYPLL